MTGRLGNSNVPMPRRPIWAEEPNNDPPGEDSFEDLTFEAEVDLEENAHWEWVDPRDM